MVLDLFRTLLFFAIFSSMQLEGYQVEPEQLDSNRLYLQVGAYSREAYLRKMEQRLEKFPLWHERYGAVTRLFVVLPKERNKRRRYLKEIKTIVPDAFMRHGYRPMHRSSDSKDSAQWHQCGEPLDSHAILKTRKKFF